MTSDPGDQSKNQYLIRPWHTGGSVGRAIYAQLGAEPGSERDPLLGFMDTPELAASVVRDHNATQP